MKLKPAADSKNKKFIVILGIGLTLLTLFSFYGIDRKELTKKNSDPAAPAPIKLKDWIHSGLAKKTKSENPRVLTPPPAPEEKTSELQNEELKKIFEQEDLCRLVKLDVYYKEEIISYFGSKDTEILLEIVNKGESPEANLFNGKPIAEIFLRTLYYSGLIFRGEGNSFLDASKANLLWEELYKKDPDNGAVDFYFMAYQSKLGVKSSALVKHAEAMLAKTNYDDHYFEVSRTIYENSLRGPAHWAVGVGLISQIPIPDSPAGHKVLQEIAKTTTDAALKKRLIEWAMHQVSKGTKLEGELEMIEWSILDYAYSQRLLKKLGVKVPDYQAFVDNKARRESTQFELDAMTDVFDYDKKGCSTAKFEEVIRRQRDLYDKVRHTDQ